MTYLNKYHIHKNDDIRFHTQNRNIYTQKPKIAHVKKKISDLGNRTKK